MNRLVALLLAVSACASNDPSAEDPGPDAGTTMMGSGSAASCDPNLPHESSGAVIHTNSTTTGANPQRDYCMTVTSATQIRLDLSGGDCGQYTCTGDDLEMVLKRGEVPDAYSPDASTTAWTYTPDPNGFGTYMVSAQPGVWYLSLIDGAYTLGYTDVTIKLTF